MPTCHSHWHFKLFLMDNYFKLSLVVGVVVSTGVVVSIPSKVLSNLKLLSPPLGIAKFANKINANIAIAKVQVVLSKKLFVFCTPPKDAPPPPPKEEDNPPP